MTLHLECWALRGALLYPALHSSSESMQYERQFTETRKVYSATNQNAHTNPSFVYNSVPKHRVQVTRCYLHGG